MAKFMATCFLQLISVGYLLFIMMILPSSVTVARPYELIYNTDSTTDVSGSIILRCRDKLFAEPLNIRQNQIKFWLNRTSACDLDLEARDDIQVIRVDDYRIKLNITHNLDGIYTCGQLVVQNAEIVVEESDPVTLVSFQTLVPVPSSVQTTFTARVGDTAVLRCPIEPGALLQFYSVIWMKDSTSIAKRVNYQDFMSIDPERYDIDDDYSLLIHSVDANDSSSTYKCVLSVTYPRTDTKQELQPYQQVHEIPLTLNIIESDEEITISTLKPTSIVVNSLTEKPSFTCVANAPNITMSWTFINSQGEETSLIDHEDGVKYRIIMNDGPDRNSTTKSTLTLLELPTNGSAIVRCKISSSFGTTAAKPDGFFIINYSVFPDEETTRCHRRDKAVFIGLIAACVGTVLVSAVIVGVVIVVCCYHLKTMKRSYHV